MVEVCFSKPQRVSSRLAAGRDVRLAVFAGRVAVSAGGTVSAGNTALSVGGIVSVAGIAAAPAGTATTRTGEALPPLRFRQISSSSDFEGFGLLRDSTTATSKPLGTGCVKSSSFAYPSGSSPPFVQFERYPLRSPVSLRICDSAVGLSAACRPLSGIRLFYWGKRLCAEVVQAALLLTADASATVA